METASKIRATRRLSRQGYGQRNGKKAKAKGSTSSFNGHGFLKHRFLPMMDGSHEQLKDWRSVERDFFSSLGYFLELYGFTPADVSGRVFPDNIRFAYQQAAAELTLLRPDLKLLIVQERNTTVKMATVRPFDTGMTLYYVPVRPIWELIQDKKQKRLAGLLLSVYAYLYQVANLPYYTEGRSYLCGTYEMMEEWVTQDPSNFDADDYTAQIDNFNALKWFGKKIRDKIGHPYHLKQFAKRVQDFHPSDEAETSLHRISQQFLDLYNAYPDRSIFDNIREGWIDPQEEERIYPEQYLSFYWDYNDCIYQSLIETINYDLQEKSVSDEPLGIQLFDQPQHKISTHELDFEKRFFELVNDLTALL